MSAILPAERVQLARNLMISHLTLHKLEGSHRLTELFSVVYVLYREVKCRLHEPIDGERAVVRSKARTIYPRGPPLRTSRSRSRPDIRTDTPLSTLPKTFSAQTKFVTKVWGKRTNHVGLRSPRKLAHKCHFHACQPCQVFGASKIP